MKSMEQVLHENIFRYRRLANLTQQEVADELGINRSTYARQENSGHIKTGELKTLAQLFGVTVEILLADPEEQIFKAEVGNKFPKRRVTNKPITIADTTINPNDGFSSYDATNIYNERLTTNERNIVKIFRSLPNEKRKRIQDFIQAEAKRQ